MTEHYRLTANINSKLGAYVTGLEISNDQDYFDQNKEAEYFFCKPLSLLFDACVTDANEEINNCPAVDLWDKKKRIAFQITSTRTKAKVQHTLDEFLDNDMDADFDRLIVLIVTTEKLQSFANLTFKRHFDFDPKQDVWNIRTLAHKFKALPFEERNKLQDFSDYLDAELPNVGSNTPFLYLPPSSALSKSGFVGRQAEVARIQGQIDAGEKLIVLRGLGGMGKTELAVRFGQDYEDGAVYFIQFEDSFTHTIAKMANGIRPELTKDELSRSDEELCESVLKILENCGDRDILIIDNVDSDQKRMSDLKKDPVYRKLSDLDLRLFLTTRFEWGQSVGIDRMDDDTLYTIFENHRASISRKEMKALIDVVNGHTLTIDLIARTLADNWEPVTAEEMLTALENSTLAEEDFGEVETYYNQSPEQVQIYQHLRTVFKVAKIPEAEQNILRCATLLPQTGMYFDLFRDSLPEEWRKSLAPLGRRGWLTKEGDLISIHPVIRLVCRVELKPSDENCEDFLDAVWEHCDRTNYDNDIFRNLAELFSNASDHLTDFHGLWSHHAGWFWRHIGRSQTALTYELQLLSHCKNNQFLTPEVHAITHNNLGSTFDDLGDYERALMHKREALRILRQSPSPNPSTLAIVYNNIGLTYYHLKQDKKALKYMRKALKTCESDTSTGLQLLATTYNNIGLVFSLQRDPEQALDFHQKALSIQRNLLPQNTPQYADVCNNIGTCYSDLGFPSESLDYLLEAMRVREKDLQPLHPSLANSYNNISCTYARIDDYVKAADYAQKALTILEANYPPDHPSIAIVRRNLEHYKLKIG